MPAGFSGDTLDVKLRADWLVCKDVCIPEGGDFTLRVPVQAATAGHGALFESARAAMPQPAAGSQASATVENGALVLKVSGLPAAWQGKALSYFPETTGVINNAAKPETRWERQRTGRHACRWTRSAVPRPRHAQRAGGRRRAHRRAGAGGGDGRLAGCGRRGHQLAAADRRRGAAAPAAPQRPPPAWAGPCWRRWWAARCLNLMPCVFPVLSLKVMGFAGHAHDRRALLAGGLAYTAGVVLSFVALAGLLLALRAGGEQLGWGFQLQSPAVVASLAALFTLIGLNLAGVFELGSVLPSSLAAARARHPVVDSALTGVLAVAVASPCTAPFMGASLGLAVTLPTAEALSVFAALGFGMALPYLAASAWPRVAQAMPRPGVWMSHFKTLDGLPDVCHRGVAGLGAGPADGHRRRRRAAAACWWLWPLPPGRWAPRVWATRRGSVLARRRCC